MFKKLKENFSAGDGAALVGLVAFLIYKLINLSFRFGDGDAYWYMANSIWNGILPYRDFFIADPPVFLLFLAELKLVFSAHWILYQALPIFLEAVNAGILYLLLRDKLKLAWLAVPLYLFSFTVLGTSFFTTGDQLTILFCLLAWFAEKI
jgi:hypothetical protein